MYKRQHLHRAERLLGPADQAEDEGRVFYLCAGTEAENPGGKLPGDDSGSFRADAGIPVSYTHLDVYKRQWKNKRQDNMDS